MNTPKAFSELLPDVSKALSLDEKAASLAVLDLWQVIIQENAPQYLKYTEAIRITERKTLQGEQRNILTVRVSDVLVASNMQFLCDDLCCAINQYIAQTGIKIDAIEMQVKNNN